MSQQETPQHHHHDHGEPSSSSSPNQIGPSSSSSSSLPISATSTQASPHETILNARHYAMLLNNNYDDLLSEINQGSNFSDPISKPGNNTILHVAASVGQLDTIYMIIHRRSNLLYVPNSRGDLPVHVAARACQLEAVEKLVVWAEEIREISTMLEKGNEDDNTALHIALLNHQKKMAKFLFEKCPKTFYHLNKQGYSPLYLAIKAQCWDLAKDMLSDNMVAQHAEDAESHLLAGVSVVHAAIIAKKIDILVLMTGAYEELLFKLTDEMKRTPLSYAAYTGFLEGVKYIMNEFENQPFKLDENGCFPIHWACRGGNLKIVKEFFLQLPKSTRFLLTNNGQNILHVAAENGKAEVVKYILRQPGLETLINMKDGEDGDTPFHLATKGKHPKVVYDLTWDDRVILTLQNNLGLTALDIAGDYYADIPSFEERLTWLSLTYAGVPRAPQWRYFNIVNINDPRNTTNLDTIVQNNNTSPAFISLDQQKDSSTIIHHKPKRKHKYKERINTLLVVSILVTTVTYASGFTVPGGYNNNAPNEGMATLAHKHAFQVFLISNTIAMYTSILAAVTLIWAHLDDLRLVMLSLDFALPLLGISLVMMSVAFMAGLYVVLHSLVSWLSIVVLVMGGLFLGALMVLFIPLYSPTCIRNTILRYVFHVPFKIMLLACEKGKS